MATMVRKTARSPASARALWRAVAIGCSMWFIGIPPARAALSPYYQSLAEFRAIIDDAGILDAIQSQDAIISIGTTAPDVYEVRTERCVVTVNIVDVQRDPDEPPIVGPRRFNVEIAGTKCQ